MDFRQFASSANIKHTSVKSICGSGFFTPVWEWELEREIIREWEQIIVCEWIRELTLYCLYFFVILFYTPTGHPQ
jgi:hypothetical protein